GRTFAQMNSDEKQRLSHRSRAVAAWLSALRKS
ncbi:MAG: non-canonical purine NTP pyrophosphatase, partial [Schleiferiaceae bacterium]